MYVSFNNRQTSRLKEPNKDNICSAQLRKLSPCCCLVMKDPNDLLHFHYYPLS